MPRSLGILTPTFLEEDCPNWFRSICPEIIVTSAIEVRLLEGLFSKDYDEKA